MKPSMPVPAIRHEFHMQVVVDSGHRVSLPAVFSYSAEDPYAVSATFRTGEGDITWVFARDLLRVGINEPAGEGDIQIRPAHPSLGGVVTIALTSPSGRAYIEGKRADLAEFVSACFDGVPEGSEWMYVDLDATIDDLLGGEPV